MGLECRRVIALFSIFLLPTIPALADDLTELSLEELLSVEVTSVAKRPQSADEAAAALYVISQDDIRKTGATTIPELLRVVPGLEVADMDGNTTAVSARDFNWRFSNKLLVLIDGRAVYQSVFSGVLWDQQMVPVEDIDRIEVIRGPGATLYGANAVNGVVNIVTKHSVDTLGGLLTLKGGVKTSSDLGFGRFMARQGTRLGEKAAVRVYVTGRDTPSLISEGSGIYDDGARSVQSGFRSDWEPNAKDAFTLQADYQKLDFETTLASSSFSGSMAPGFSFATDFPLDTSVETASQKAEGLNVLGRWTRSWSKAHSLTFQTYFDYIKRSEFDADFAVKTMDVDFSHYFSWAERFETVWGVGYRSTDDKVVAGGFVDFQDPSFHADLYNAFIQQDVSFYKNKLRFSLGSKFEHNSFTGFEIQPSLRAIWVDESWSFWGAASRAVRTPSRFENSLAVSLGPIPAMPSLGLPLPITVQFNGDANQDAEDLLSFEIGFRKKWQNGAKLDLTAYYHDYKDLLIVTFGEGSFQTAPIGPFGSLIPVGINQELLITNAAEAHIYGLEAAFEFKTCNICTVKFSGDVKEPVSAGVGASSQLNLGQPLLGDSPTYQLSMRSDLDITSALTTSLWLRRVGALAKSEHEGYTDLDVRVGYRFTPRLEANLLAENLIKSRRQEFSSSLYPAPYNAIERKFSASMSVRF